jgi:hypothetical protein
MKERGGSIFYWLPFSFWLLVPFFCTREISLLLSYLSSLLFFLLFSFTYTHTHRGRKTKDLRERLTVIEGVLENSFSSFFAIFFLLCLSCRDKERKRESQTESEKESLERNFYLSKLLAE